MQNVKCGESVSGVDLHVLRNLKANAPVAQVLPRSSCSLIWEFASSPIGANGITSAAAIGRLLVPGPTIARQQVSRALLHWLPSSDAQIRSVLSCKHITMADLPR